MAWGGHLESNNGSGPPGQDVGQSGLAQVIPLARYRRIVPRPVRTETGQDPDREAERRRLLGQILELVGKLLADT